MPPRYQRRAPPPALPTQYLARPHPLARFFVGRYTGGAGAGHSTTRLMGVLTPVQTPSEAGGDERWRHRPSPSIALPS